MKVSLAIRVLVILLSLDTSCLCLPSSHSHGQLRLNVTYHHQHLLGPLRDHNLKINRIIFHCSAHRSVFNHTKQQTNPLQENSVCHEDHSCPAVTMSSLITGTEYEHMEPSTLLSNSDIINLLLKSCDKISYENIKLEREHTNAKISAGVNNIQKVLNTMTEEIASQNTKIADLELKLETTNNYQVELMHSLKRGLQATFLNIEYDVNSLASKLNSCEICGKAFQTFHQLLVHMIKEHEQVKSQGSQTSSEQTVARINSNLSDNSLTSERECNEHTTITHESPHLDNSVEISMEKDVLPQIDGNDSIEDNSDVEFTPVQIDENDPALICSGFSFDKPIGTTSLPTVKTTTNRTAKFTLNKEKQVVSLGADTKLADFEIVVNDGDKNVSIQCSSAFYQAIARPVLGGLEKQTSLNVENIPVICHHIDYNRDRHGVEYNRVLHLHLGGGGKHSQGKVTIHLHHTKRNIQMQGSAIMPDQTTAPVWFLKYFIEQRFTDLAASKRVDISLFNKKIEELVRCTNHGSISNTCSKCLKHFSANSVPTMCFFCRQFFHKSTCLPQHTSTCPARRQPGFPATRSTTSYGPTVDSSEPALTDLSIVPLIPFSSSPSEALATSAPARVSTPPNHSATLSAPTSRHPCTNPSKRPRSDSSSAATPSASSTPSLTGVPPIVTLTNVTTAHRYSPALSTLAPSASFVGPASSTSNASLNVSVPPFNPTPNAAPVNNKRKNKTKPVSPEKSKVDFLNLELDSAKTRIVQLETENEDKDISIKILNEKIKLLEQSRPTSQSPKHNNPNYQCPCPSSGTLPSQHHRLLTSCSLSLSCQHPCPHHHPSHHCHVLPACQRTPEPVIATNHPQDTILPEIKSILNNIQDGIQRLSCNFDDSRTRHGHITPSNSAVKPSASVINMESNEEQDAILNTGTANPNHIETVVEIIEHENDDSIASTDYFVPEPNLNSIDQTIQQPLLMH